MTFYSKYLDTYLTFTDLDEWTSYSKDNYYYDIHYDDENHSVYIYEFHPDIDSISHRYKLLDQQEYFLDFYDFASTLLNRNQSPILTLSKVIEYREFYNNQLSYNDNLILLKIL